MNDPISEMMIKIKNAGAAGKGSLLVSLSKLKMAVAETLLKEGYIKSFSRKGKKAAKYLEIELSYDDDRPTIEGFKRISKLSKRVYQKAKDIKPVKYGQGTLVISTPKGVVTGSEARKMNVGGEALFKIW